MPSVFTLEGPQQLRPAPCRARDVDPEQLRVGTQIEMEHTQDRKAAQLIALHHLCETYPHPYYITGTGVQHERLLLNGMGLPPIAPWVKWLALGAGAVGVVLAGRWTHKNWRYLKRLPRRLIQSREE